MVFPHFLQVPASAMEVTDSVIFFKPELLINSLDFLPSSLSCSSAIAVYIHQYLKHPLQTLILLQQQDINKFLKNILFLLSIKLFVKLPRTLSERSKALMHIRKAIHFCLALFYYFLDALLNKHQETKKVLKVTGY